MTYTVEPGQMLRKRMETRSPGSAINEIMAHAFLITDIERFTLAAWMRAALHRTPKTDALAERVLLVGLDWEHHQALLSNTPAERTAEDIAEQERLAAETEILAGEIDVRTGVVNRNGNPFPPFLEEVKGE